MLKFFSQCIFDSPTENLEKYFLSLSKQSISTLGQQVYTSGIQPAHEHPRHSTHLPVGWKRRVAAILCHTGTFLLGSHIGQAIVVGGLGIPLQANVSVFSPQDTPAVAGQPIVRGAFLFGDGIGPHFRAVALHDYRVVDGSGSEVSVVPAIVKDPFPVMMPMRRVHRDYHGTYVGHRLQEVLVIVLFQKRVSLQRGNLFGHTRGIRRIIVEMAGRNRPVVPRGVSPLPLGDDSRVAARQKLVGIGGSPSVAVAARKRIGSAGHELLDAQLEEFSGLNGKVRLEGGGGSKGPARSAVALVLDGGGDAVLPPIDEFGEMGDGVVIGSWIRIGE